MLAYAPALWTDILTNWRSKGMWLTAAGFILCVPVFAAYAILGEQRANRVLVAIWAPINFLYTLPERALHAIDRRVKKHVVMPDEFRDPPPIEPPARQPQD